METLSVKYICKLSALIFLLAVGFVYKVPKAGKVTSTLTRHQNEFLEQTGYTNVSLKDDNEPNELYHLVVPAQKTTTLVTL